MPVEKIDPEKQAEKEARVYWKILETSLELHPYLKINIFYQKYRVMIRLSEINKKGIHKLVAEGLDKSLNQAIIQNNKSLFAYKNKTVILPSYRMLPSNGKEMKNLRDIPQLILDKKYRITISAQKDKLTKEIVKIVQLESSTKKDGILRKTIQESSGIKSLSELILDAAATERKII